MDNSPSKSTLLKRISVRIIGIVIFLILCMVIGIGLTDLFFWYQSWDPHLGEPVYDPPHSVFCLTSMEAMEQLRYNGCPDMNAGKGWKFVKINYNMLNSNGNKKAIYMHLIRFADENSVSYPNYYNDCLPQIEFGSYQEIPDGHNRNGNFIFRIPLFSVPAKLDLLIDGKEVTYSLHMRHFL